MSVRLASCLGLLSVMLLAVGCHKPKAPTPKPSAKAPPSASVATRASASASASTPAAPVKLSVAHLATLDSDPYDTFQLSDAADASFQREVLVARKAAANKQYQAALTHYTQALSTGKNDAACLSERGYVRYLQNDLPAAMEDLMHAAGAGGADELIAQVWYNVGLVHTGLEQAEEARAAYARSLELRPNRTVEAKIGAGSRCTSSIHRQSEPDPDATLLASWTKTQTFLGIAGDPKNEEQARKLVCSANGLSEPGQMETDCRDGSVFTVSCCGGFGRFMLRTMSVVPRPSGQVFAVQHGSRGGWPRGCQGVAEPELAIYGKVLVVADKGAEVEPNFDYHSAEVFPEDPPCRFTPNSGRFAFYDLDRGTRLALVVSLARLAPELDIDEAGTTLTLSGHGCSERIALK